MNLFKQPEDINFENYIIANYYIATTSNLRDAAWNLAIGQSVGNPNVRNEWETDELFNTYSCLILEDEEYLKTKISGFVKIAFPIINSDWETDGISHLLCQLMGGHLDIDIINSCSLVDIVLPTAVTKYFHGPKFGISGIRKYTSCYGKPVLGGIIKPKTGISKEILLEMTKQLIDGGVNFIKEDEIMSNASCAPLRDRVELISNYLAKQNSKVIFCHTINCDPHILVDRVNMVYQLGGNGVHINVWSGLGSYNSIRKLNLPLFLHFQKSGDKIFTDSNHRFNIRWSVICKLATLMGVDTIQAGMIGGYSNDSPEILKEALWILRNGNTLPALSCGRHPGQIGRAHV